MAVADEVSLIRFSQHKRRSCCLWPKLLTFDASRFWSMFLRKMWSSSQWSEEVRVNFCKYITTNCTQQRHGPSSSECQQMYRCILLAASHGLFEAVLPSVQFLLRSTENLYKREWLSILEKLCLAEEKVCPDLFAEVAESTVVVAPTLHRYAAARQCLAQNFARVA